MKEQVENPFHYKGDIEGYECWDYINAHGLDYFLGNAVKYITRCAYKGSEEMDIRKAIRYLEKALQVRGYD